MPDMNVIHTQMVHGLQTWMLLSVTMGLLGLYVRSGGSVARGYWLMMGLCGVLAGLLGWWTLSSDPPSIDVLVFRLKGHLLLDLLFLALGVLLAGRHAPVLRGFGLAILVQGGFLMLFDLYFYSQCWV